MIALSLHLGPSDDGDKEVLMSYLVCDKRKGSPKVHIEVCKKKCKSVDECKTYKEFIDNMEKKAA